jgi:predicted alpha/beta superfamily hydrolase
MKYLFFLVILPVFLAGVQLNGQGSFAGGLGIGSHGGSVIVMDENFFMPQLDRTRRIWLYLPPGYETSGKSYPVLYMHDGQNLFDASTSFAGEWQVDETLNGLYGQGLEVPIVVGIDNGGMNRIGEYTPWPHAVHGGGDGDLYVQFIIQTLKPHIDQNYRTLPGREHTGIMGSSLGALISHYAALQYPEVFSKAGLFSPSYWWSANVWPFTSEAGHQDAMRIYLMCGGQEGQGTINNMLAMRDTLLASGFSEDEVVSKIIPGGQHNENLWRQDFGEAYLWLFGSFANNINVIPGRTEIMLFPNPTAGILYLPEDFPGEFDSIEAFDNAGKPVLKQAPFYGKQVDVSRVSPGAYHLMLFSKGEVFQGRFIKE